MQLDLRPFFSGAAKPFSFMYALDLSGYELRPGVRPFRTPVRVSGTVKNLGGGVTIRVKASFQFFTVCDRCGRPVVESYRMEFRHTLVEGTESDDQGGDLLPVDPDAFSVDGYVTANIVLELPSKHLCRSDCKGLCPRCGKNLNDGPCGCGAV